MCSLSPFPIATCRRSVLLFQRRRRRLGAPHNGTRSGIQACSFFLSLIEALSSSFAISALIDRAHICPSSSQVASTPFAFATILNCFIEWESTKGQEAQKNVAVDLCQFQAWNLK